MIKTHEMLMKELESYRAPGNKIMRMVHSGELVPIARGVYETESDAPVAALAASIYGPSYVSFEYALGRYGLIPERAVVVTSATFEKRRRKVFTNAFGRFSFQDIPSKAFPWGLRIDTELGRPFRIATPEKALCDQLYKAPPVGSMKALRELLYGSWRIDEQDIAVLDIEQLAALASKYQRSNLRILSKAIEKGKL